MNYQELINKIGYSNEVVKIARGDVIVPKFTYEAPFDPAFGFPPALIPLWSCSSWPGYVGIVRDWFGDNADSFVQFFIEEHEFVEVAKNLEQLKAWLVFDFLCNVPAPDEVERFAHSIAFNGKDDVEGYFAGIDDTSDLAKLDVFKSDPPAIFAVSEEKAMPLWLEKSEQTCNLIELLDKGEMAQVWKVLNSNMRDRGEIKNILVKMSEKNSEDSSLFSDLTKCWLDSND